MPVTGRCGSCTGPLPVDARFCPGCGTPVTGGGGGPPSGLDESIGQALATELRDLTVVVCDLVGSTELSALTDPEEYGDLIQAYQHRAVTIVRSLGGDVEGYSGDGILFRFGWPEAHKDDAARALTAALAVVADLGRSEETRGLAVRVGVHSGPAVVGELGGADRRATMAVGETLNVAARLQGLAEPDTVVASAATLALAGDGFDRTPLGPQALRGIPEPVEAYRVHSPVDGRRAATPARRWSPLVGRDAEMASLRRAWDDARAGRGRGVLVTGEPGVGKTRMVDWLRDRVGADDALWLQGSCAPYTRMSVLRPVVDLVEAELDLHDVSNPTWRLARLRSEFDRAGVDVPDGHHLVGALLGVPGTAVESLGRDLRLERTIDTLVAWVVALGRRRPLVLCIEDLHWCDPTTLDAVARLLEQVAGAPVLVLLTARPEFVPTWAAVPGVETVPLGPLADAQVRELATALGDGLPLPDPVLDRIVTSAGGIPLYVEEVGRTVLESGLLVREGDHWDLASTCS